MYWSKFGISGLTLLLDYILVYQPNVGDSFYAVANLGICKRDNVNPHLYCNLNEILLLHWNININLNVIKSLSKRKEI